MDGERERELRLMWLERGKPPQQFSAERMEIILARETEKQLGDLDEQDMGQDRLAEKMDQIETTKRGEITVSKVLNGTLSIGKVIGKEVRSLGGEFGGMFEPGFRKQARNKKKNMLRVAKEDRETKGRAIEVKRLRASLSEEIKVEAVKRVVNIEQIKETEPTAEIAHQLKVDQEAKERAIEMENFLKRRQLEVDEKIRLKKLKEEKERAKIEKKDKIRRDFAQTYWKEKEVEYRKDAEEMRQIKDEETARRQQQVIRMDADELKKREFARLEEQVVGPAVSSKLELPNGGDLGIFAVPKGKGEYASDVRGDGADQADGRGTIAGNIPGVDDHTVDLFQRPQHTAFEENKIKLMDSESEVGRKESLYETLKTETKLLREEIDNNGQLKSRLVTELQQNQAEMENYCICRRGRHGETPRASSGRRHT